MSKQRFGIGATVMAVALTAGMIAVQGTETAGDQVPGRLRAQGVTPPPGGQAQGQMGPGQMGQGQMGQARGRAGRGGFGPGQGLDQGRGAGAGGRAAGRGPMPGPQLGLTDDQRTQMQALQRTNRDRAAAVQDELEFTRRTLHREIFADVRDNAKVTALATKVTTLEKQLFDLHLKTQTAVADLLTPAQRETMRLSGGGQGRGPGAPNPRPLR